MPRSFFPLVDVDSSVSKNRYEANSEKLTKHMISQAEDILKQIFNRKKSSERADAAS